MRPWFVLAALLALSSCAAGPRCDTHLTPINASVLRRAAASGAAPLLPGRHASRRGGRGGRS